MVLLAKRNGVFSAETPKFLINATYLLVISCKEIVCMLTYQQYVPNCGLSTKTPYEIKENRIYFPKNEKRRIEIQERHDEK